MMINRILEEDCAFVAESPSVDWDRLSGKTILVTGATGLIGSSLVRTISYADDRLDLGVKVVALVRDVERARELLAEELRSFRCISLLEGDVVEQLNIDEHIDYVIHTASPTASSFFVNNPVETLRTAVIGTDNIIRIAMQTGAEGFVYLSSMEIYGAVTEEALLDENTLGPVDPLSTRSCYPESKRACEALVSAYASEYGMRAMSVRLAQTFGAGVPSSDRRIFAMMARCAMRGDDIILQTKGESRNPYVYTAQAVEAILCILFRGEGGMSYNVANPSTYCSIVEMGELVSKVISNGNIHVRFNEHGDASKYPPTRYWKLDTSKVEALGWKSRGTLEDMYRRMIQSMQCEDSFAALSE